MPPSSPSAESPLERYHRDGFVVVRGLLTPDEVQPIAEACTADPTFGGKTVVYGTGGAPTPLLTWWKLGETLFGRIPRVERMVRLAESMVGEEVYHWHSLLVRKAPRLASQWYWHTGYGTYYYDGCLFPDRMVNAIVAVTPSTVANGCLRMVRGSHRLGRLDHVLVGGEVCADPARMPHILDRMEVVDLELEPGDVTFFHGNTVHASGPNTTDHQRIVLVVRYNGASNEPFDLDDQLHHRYRPLDRVPDGMIGPGRYDAIFDVDDLYAPEKAGAAEGKNIIHRFGQSEISDDTGVNISQRS